VIIGYLVARRIVSHRFGRSFKAIRDNDVAARAMGVNVAKYQILANAIFGVYCGSRGTVRAHEHLHQPDIFDQRTALFVQAMTLIGGWAPCLARFSVALLCHYPWSTCAPSRTGSWSDSGWPSCWWSCSCRGVVGWRGVWRKRWHPLAVETPAGAEPETEKPDVS